MCTRYPIINRVSELKVHIELTRFVQPEKIEIDANERAVNEKSPYCFFVCTTFDSFHNDFMISFLIQILPYFSDSVHLLVPTGRKTFLHIHPCSYTTGLRDDSCYDFTHDILKFCYFLFGNGVIDIRV